MVWIAPSTMSASGRLCSEKITPTTAMPSEEIATCALRSMRSAKDVLMSAKAG